MGYRVPSMPITANIWRGGAPLPVGPPQIVTKCQLRLIKDAFIISASVVPYNNRSLLILPKGTDIRSLQPGPLPADFVEVPAGTGIYWNVLTVGDVAKGFANEYRAATISCYSYPLPRP
jgi:hypothetical protein